MANSNRSSNLKTFGWDAYQSLPVQSSIHVLRRWGLEAHLWGCRGLMQQPQNAFIAVPRLLKFKTDSDFFSMDSLEPLLALVPSSFNQIPSNPMLPCSSILIILHQAGALLTQMCIFALIAEAPLRQKPSFNTPVLRRSCLWLLAVLVAMAVFKPSM